MKSSQEWLAYYQMNAATLMDVPWNVGPDLNPADAQAIRQSLREFQAGERSEGLHLIANAKQYGEKVDDPAYVETIRMFVLEEQRHARDLGRFLELNGIALVTTTFTDTVFRRLRNLVPSLEVSIGVLITAEIIAKVYYAALQKATSSIILRRLCDQILRDELSHVAFQSDYLHRLRANRRGFLAALTRGLQGFLFFGTVLVVWLFHRRVMLRAGGGLGDWWNACWFEFNTAFP